MFKYFFFYSVCVNVNFITVMLCCAFKLNVLIDAGFRALGTFCAGIYLLCNVMEILLRITQVTRIYTQCWICLSYTKTR